MLPYRKQRKAVDPTLFLAGLVATVSIMASISWIRSDMKALEMEIKNERKSFEMELRSWKNEVNKEMKDFHGRLCAIDEKNKK